ncbi:amino acid/polyamine/organocation transporter, APC superfamily [Bryocella elongata]|uniref:Amino acid/polyamine/organocation transporter, APC superfamily n=1 Tax=Bryocella elongata TaxID=863522 RepID=A0A1H5X3G6_9BACT|nr:APC family permease [Bryocella elongata]SEG05897.1 amino acid/polyamine/organocation transporter, APC superfamily [Bryocella elongata]
MSFFDVVLGRPIATVDEHGEHIGPIAGIPVFGLDALSSAAYGPEAALTLLIPLGLAGLHYILPVTAAILVLLVIVFFSYLQTIDAYPNGGGSYTVATENMGERAGLLAAAALMIDYILNAAVGISAGVGAIISAFPALQPHTTILCLAVLAGLTLVNLRGIKDSGLAFLAPTYLFCGSLLFVIGLGLWRAYQAGGHPAAIVAPPHLPIGVGMLPLWLLAKVFASGCTAMTGVEAVSNGVMAFRQPACRNAKKTLTMIILLLMALLAGIALLCRAYGIGATDPSGAGYQSVLSQLIGAVIGRGWFYYVSMGSIFAVLALSANTSFADFPRLTRAIAMHDFLPHVFLIRGRRLLFSHGIYALVGFTALLLIIFQGVTDRLIPLFAIGAFLAFTLSQAGMVVHWLRVGGPRAKLRMVVNGLGAVATGVTLLVVLVAKFREGAWVTALLIPLLILLMASVRRHYDGVREETTIDRPIHTDNLVAPLVIVPVDRWSKIAEKGLRFALKLSDEVEAVHVDAEDRLSELEQHWEANIADPIRAIGRTPPRLISLPSPFRFVMWPLLEHILAVEREHPERQIAVLIPELVVKHWWQAPLHNQRSQMLKLLLLVKGNQRITVINIPWYL